MISKPLTTSVIVFAVLGIAMLAPHRADTPRVPTRNDPALILVSPPVVKELPEDWESILRAPVLRAPPPLEAPPVLPVDREALEEALRVRPPRPPDVEVMPPVVPPVDSHLSRPRRDD